MAISSVGAAAVPFAFPTLPTAPTAPTGGPAGAGAAGKGLGASFADSLQSVQALTDGADSAAAGVATGTLADVHHFTSAAAKASLGVELTAALRDRAVGAYQEIMRMQV